MGDDGRGREMGPNNGDRASSSLSSYNLQGAEHYCIIWIEPFDGDLQRGPSTGTFKQFLPIGTTENGRPDMPQNLKLGYHPGCHNRHWAVKDAIWNSLSGTDR
jgi:hypothetical protein